MNWKIPLFKILWDDKDIKNVNKVLMSGMNWAEGAVIKEFEQAIADYAGLKYCVVFCNGTAALHAALSAYGIKNNNEVIVPSFTFIATANAPLFVGAKPVFADIERETLGLDPQDVERKITKRTKVIIPVHYAGMPCKIRELKEIAKRKKILLIEDAAEAFGAAIEAKKIGTFGDTAMFSFCQNKIITTGEGGALVTEDKKIYERLKLIRSHGRAQTGNYFSSIKPFDYVDLGYNFRVSSFTAALGLSQLEKTANIIKKRRSNARYFLSALKNNNSGQISLLDELPGYFNVYQLFSILVNRNRDELMRYLASKGIMTKVYFPCVHLTHFYKNKLKYKCNLPVSEEISRRILSMPMYPELRKPEIDFMAREIKIFFRRKK